VAKDASDSIQNLINALMDLDHQFPSRLLYQFSDLSSSEQKTLASCWSNVPLKRRQAFLQDLVSLAENDPVLMYEEVARIALDDEDSDVCISAIDLLFGSEDRHLIPVYLGLLADQTRSEAVRAAVANALGPYVYLGEIEKIKPEILHEIEDTLLHTYYEDKSDLVKRRALEALGYSSREEVPALLRTAAAMRDDLWLESAMFAMGRSTDEQWEGSVLENLEHENLAVRIQAVHAAGELALKKARRNLLRAIDMVDDDDLRHEIIWALAQIGGEGVERKFDALLASAEDDEEAAFLEEAMEMLNFTEGSDDMELLSVPWDQTKVAEEDEEDEFEEDEDEFSFEEDFDDEEWQQYVADDDDLADDDEYSFGEFDDDRFN
jgi:HEAT repeat protein